MINQQIAVLNRAGQSIWYDNVSRQVLRSGELAGLIAQGVSGLTSNPTIFKKAIADSAEYDTDIAAALRQGLNTDAICEQLMAADIGAAADLLRPVFDSTNGRDGFASIEVSPLLAADTEATLSHAQRLWSTLNRPNVMIKVPATAAGIPAIRLLIAEGINVNVTLIFGIEVYAEVMEAYLAGLEERLRQGQTLAGVNSVASFFVSRLDVLSAKILDGMAAEGRIDRRAPERLFGRPGIANSKEAYQRFTEVFTAPRFLRLQATGAKVQRPLWASTGTKSDRLDPLHYVWALAGRDTVNTLPPQTLTALLESPAAGEPGLTAGLDEAERVLEDLQALGVSMPQLVHELERDGVKQFADSYREVLESVTSKSRMVAV